MYETRKYVGRRGSRPKVVFMKLTGKQLCQSLLIKKENLVQVFSCEFCEIFF